MARLSVYYSLTHECYRVDYTGRYDHPSGYIDGCCRLHLGSISLDKKIGVGEYLKIKYKNRRPLKKAIAYFFLRLSAKLDPPDAKYHAPKRPWWKI